jgi:hypothetical protein
LLESNRLKVRRAKRAPSNVEAGIAAKVIQGSFESVGVSEVPKKEMHGDSSVQRVFSQKGVVSPLISEWKAFCVTSCLSFSPPCTKCE